MHRKSTRLKKGELAALQSKTNQLKLQDHTSKIVTNPITIGIETGQTQIRSLRKTHHHQ